MRLHAQARRRLLPQNNKARYQRYSDPSGSRAGPVTAAERPSPLTYMRSIAPIQLTSGSPAQATYAGDDRMQPRRQLPSLTLPVPNSSGRLPRLDRPQVSLDDPESLTLPPLRMSADEPFHRHTRSDGYIPSMDSLSAGLPSVSRLPRPSPAPETMDAPPRSASTRPYVRGSSNNLARAGSGQNNHVRILPQSFTPEPSAHMQTSTRMPSTASRTRTPQQPGYSQSTRASRGMSSTEEAGAHGHTPAENLRSSGSD